MIKDTKVKGCEIFGPRRFGAQSIKSHTGHEGARLGLIFWPFIDCIKRGDKRWCHQTDKVQIFLD